jgi:hypothetical protein
VGGRGDDGSALCQFAAETRALPLSLFFCAGGDDGGGDRQRDGDDRISPAAPSSTAVAAL